MDGIGKLLINIIFRFVKIRRIRAKNARMKSFLYHGDLLRFGNFSFFLKPCLKID